MAAAVVSAFALAFFCFLVLSAVCVGTLFAFLYRRYYGLQRRPTVVDVEAQNPVESSATSPVRARESESATLAEPSEYRDLAVVPSPKSPSAAVRSDDKLDPLTKSPRKDRPNWKRRTLSWVLTDDMQIRFSSLSASLAKAKAKAKEKWIPFDSGTSLATMDVTHISEDVPSTSPKESSSLSSRKSASDTRSLSSGSERPASAPMDPSPTPRDPVSPTLANPPLSSVSKKPVSSPRFSRISIFKKSSASRYSTSKKSTPTPQELASASTSIKLTAAPPEPAPASSASPPTLSNTTSTPATIWEPQTPPASTAAPTGIADGSSCQPSPSTDSLEVRSIDLAAAALDESEAMLASGTLPSFVSGLSDVIDCLDARGSLIEDLAKTAVHPTLGIGIDPSWLAHAAISLSLRSELPMSCATSTVPSKVISAPPSLRPTLSTSNTIATDKEWARLGTSSVSSDSKTACGAEAPEQMADDERYMALVDALSTTFSIASLQAPDSTWHSAISASTSSSPSMARSDLDLGLDTSYELSYDASESDFDGSLGSGDEGCTDKLWPHNAAGPSLHQSCSRSEQSVVTL